jgi:hypothetical protein
MASTLNDIPISHLVFFKYRSDIPWCDLQSHFDVFRRLPGRCLHPATGQPYVRLVCIGKDISWEPFDKGMTHGFVLQFASEADLNYYLTEDATHLAFSKKAHDLIEDQVGIDIRDGSMFGANLDSLAGTMQAWSGKCHCEDCEWEVQLPQGEKLQLYVCHCSTCRQLSGGPYSCNSAVSAGALKVRKGTPSVYVYEGHSGTFTRSYAPDAPIDSNWYRKESALFFLLKMYKSPLPSARNSTRQNHRQNYDACRPCCDTVIA